jgi:hypothetical protein
MANVTRKNKKQEGGMVTVGTKAMVFHGTAKHTSGGLTKKDLMKTKKGRIVSKKKHAAGKRAIKTLRKLGFKPTKGKFVLFKKGKTVKRGGSKEQTAAGFSLL